MSTDNRLDDRLKLVERRCILDGQEHLRPVLSPHTIHSALTEIDSALGNEEVLAGPFSVFSASPSVDAQTGGNDAFPEPTDCRAQTGIDQLDNPSIVHEEASVGCSSPDPDEGHDAAFYDDSHGIAFGNSDVDSLGTTLEMKQKIMPHLSPYLASASPVERQLLHYWITRLSGMMIPTKRSDNPFQTIYIPLALCLPGDAGVSSGNTALLHAIYALSALNQAQLCQTREHFLSLGAKHHQLSLQALNRNLAAPAQGQREALLATIITMASIEIIRGSSSSWRIHVAGGRSWLKIMGERGWCNNNDSANTLRQIFFCIEVLGFNAKKKSENPTIQDMASMGILGDNLATAMDVEESMNYTLDRIFGIPYRIFKALVQINRISVMDCLRSYEEIEELDRYIRLSDPDAQPTSEGTAYDELMHQHGCTFYCACLIHFHRSIKGTPPARLQNIVRRSLYHLGVIERLETSMDVCGLLWPLFISACEVEISSGLRDDAIRLFDKGHTHGIGNICSAATVVLEVWRRRDEMPGVDVSWKEVMDDLDIDIPLA